MQYHLDLMAAFRKRLNHMFLFGGNNKKTTMNVYEKYSSGDISTATYMWLVVPGSSISDI